MKFKFRFTIARKLTLGFGILLVVVIITNLFNYKTLDDNLKQNLDVISKIHTPSSEMLNDLSWLISNTKILIKNWVYIERKEDTPDKNKLREIHAREIPETEAALEPLVSQWTSEEDQITYRDVVESIDSLVQMHQNIMGQLNAFENYEDMMITFPIYIQTEEDGEVMVLTERILNKLAYLIKQQKDITDKTNTRMKNSFEQLQKLMLFMAILIVVFVIIIGFWTTRALVSPINYIKQVIQQMGKGILPKEEIKVTTDEIGEMSQALNSLVIGLKKTVEFSLKIGEGDFASQFAPLSEQDVLGNSLILMRENLKKAAQDEEKRKREDRQRSWAAQGLAKFGELLRMNTGDMEEFSFRIISNLVKYLDANVGGFYILNDNDSKDMFIELMACYAYGRQKYIKRRIEIGVNIIGQCVQEKDSIFLTDIPQDYIKVTSGLGSDTPRSLVVVPLKLNEAVFGVVEIGSFNVFEPYQVEFIEKLGESIASTISSVKVNINTAKLLSESREKSERLAQQEVEIRQNIERMQAAQDEMIQQIKDERQKNAKITQEYKEKVQRVEFNLKKQQEKFTKQEIRLRGTVEALNNTLGAVDYNMHGEFIFANDKALELSEIDFELLNSKHQSQFMLKEITRGADYQTLWRDLNKGIPKISVHQYFFGEKEKWFAENYTPVKDENGNFYKVISLVQDVTKEKGEEKAKAKLIADLQQLTKNENKSEISKILSDEPEKEEDLKIKPDLNDDKQESNKVERPNRLKREKPEADKDSDDETLPSLKMKRELADSEEEIEEKPVRPSRLKREILEEDDDQEKPEKGLKPRRERPPKIEDEED